MLKASHLELKDLDECRIRLKYFDCRGRAEAIRCYLRYEKILFEDDRIALAQGGQNWLEMRSQSLMSGPYGRLPLLFVDDVVIAEALVIWQLIDEKTRPSLLLGERLVHRTLQSVLYQDILVQAATLIWAEKALPGVDIAILWARTRDKIIDLWQRIQVVLQDHSDLFLKAKLSLTEFCLDESLAITEACFGPLTGKPWQALTDFRASIQDRGVALGRPQVAFTCCDDEAQILARFCEESSHP